MLPEELLASLEVPRHGVVYVQSSVDWLQRAGLRAPEMLTGLLNWLTPNGTLVMPSYPFHSTHREYLSGSPVFDVRRTPAGIGLLPEMFRRTAGVVRSADPDFAVCARGAEAEAVVGEIPAEPDPFGADSAYRRMLDRQATLVGLGVSLNTNSFIHAIDSQLGSSYPVTPYEPVEYSTTVIDRQGNTRAVRRQCLRPAFQQLIEPSAIGREMQPGPAAFTALEINAARFFRWDLAAWSGWCVTHAAARTAVAGWPCWLTRLDAAFTDSRQS